MAASLGWFLGGFIPGMPGITSGILVGIFQWLVLAQRIEKSWRWMLVTIPGWISGFLISFLLVPAEWVIIEGLLIGFFTGVAQWFILRHEIQWSGWWIVFCLLGWTTGIAFLPGSILTGTAAGVLTGIALVILLQHPKHKANLGGNIPDGSQPALKSR